VIGGERLRRDYGQVLEGLGWKVQRHDGEDAALAGLIEIHRLSGAA